jgi:Protein of unknown function (DUF4236)
VSLGPRGASLSFGSRGAYLNTGIPGSGLYSRTRLSAPDEEASDASRLALQERVDVPVRISVEDDGSVHFLDSDGNVLNDQLATLAKRQHGQKIRDFLAAMSEKLNSAVDDLERVHLRTPHPKDKPVRAVRAFPTPPPTKPIRTEVGIWARLARKAEEIEDENRLQLQGYKDAVAQWQRVKGMFEAREQNASQRFQQRLAADVEFMQQVFEDNLHDIVWPRETLVSFRIEETGSAIDIDIDLPEIDEMRSEFRNCRSGAFRRSSSPRPAPASSGGAGPSISAFSTADRV